MNCINYQTQPRQKFPENISNAKLHSPVQPNLHLYPWRYLGVNYKSVKGRFHSSFFAANYFCCCYWANKVHRAMAAPTGFLTGSVQQANNKDNIFGINRRYQPTR